MTQDIFTLRIRLGNSAMKDDFHIVHALERAAHTVRLKGFDGSPYRILDLNGNHVGEYGINIPKEK